ncbi:MAG: hypothetical protein Q8L71_08020 [Thiobacillus sp.]|nr:hypothetical protein [Thiobacillus sp.]
MDATTKTAKRILNALAFSNVNNLGEFRALLQQIDESGDPAYKPDSHDATPPASGNSPVTPYLHHIQGAL